MKARRKSASLGSAPGILVVDDDGPVRSLLDLALRQHGFAVWTAANGREALESYRTHHADIDLVLLDVRMPGLDGPQTFAELRKIDPKLPCCYMTGDSGPYSSEKLLETGAACVFKKPFSLGEILQTVRELARRS